MTLENWIAYVLAYTVISVIPGPSVLMVIGQALSRGRRAALICILGDLTGGLVVMLAAWAGVGLILAASGTAFALLKWAGVLYMGWLGLAQIRAARRLGMVPAQADPASASPARSSADSLRAGFLTGVLNPKAIMFYMAFLAQFINPAAPQVPQFLILMASSAMVVATVLGGYALLASAVATRLRSLRARRAMSYAGGGCLLGGSVLLAARG